MKEDQKTPQIGKRRTAPTPRALRWPPLDEEMILEWADAHFEREGEWPTSDSGVIVGGYGDKWSSVSQALRVGVRTLPGGSSLARLLAQYRGVRNRKGLPPYTEAQILAWCDAYHARHGKWPKSDSGPIEDAPGETWTAVSVALANTIRGITRKTSLPQLLEDYRGIPNAHNRIHLTVEQILVWADAYHSQYSEWPNLYAKPIEEMQDETWENIDRALRRGMRGLSGGCSLAVLLAEKRGRPNRLDLAELTVETILQWVDAYHSETGRWPKRNSGQVNGLPDLTWGKIDSSLIQGNRGLPGGSSLARLLADRRGVRNRVALPGLTEHTILEWADAYYARCGRWPNINSGHIEEAPDETWGNINNAMEQGSRGLAGGSSLARLLAETRGHRNTMRLPNLSIEQILSWADAHFERIGQWPGEDTGPIPEADGETWMGISAALRLGKRGLTGGSSLARLLAAARGRKLNQRHETLDIARILQWAETHHARTGRWPNSNSGTIAETDGLTWNAVNCALEHGLRGLPSGESLARLLAREYHVRNRAALPTLSEEAILNWAQAFRESSGKWPTQKSGPVKEAPGETWGGIDSALSSGSRGLPGGISLPILLDRIRKLG